MDEKGLAAEDLERLAGLSGRTVVVAEFVEGERRFAVRVEPAQRASAGPAADISRLIVAGELKDRPVVLMRDVAQAEPQFEYTDVRRDRGGRYVEIDGAFRDANVAAKVYDMANAIAGRLAPSGSYEWHGLVPRVPDMARMLVALFVPWLLVAVLSGGWRFRRVAVLPAMLTAALAPLPGVVLAGVLLGGVSVPLLSAALLSAGIGLTVMLVQIEFLRRAGPGMTLDAVSRAFPGLLALVLPWLAVTLFWFWPNPGGFWLGRFAGGLHAGLITTLLIVPSLHMLAGAGRPRSSGKGNGTK
jgi:multidrug efflux pump subunit AcrB